MFITSKEIFHYNGKCRIEATVSLARLWHKAKSMGLPLRIKHMKVLNISCFFLRLQDHPLIGFEFSLLLYVYWLPQRFSWSAIESLTWVQFLDMAFAFYFSQMNSGKSWMKLFLSQLWVNIKVNWLLKPCLFNPLRSYVCRYTRWWNIKQLRRNDE